MAIKEGAEVQKQTILYNSVPIQFYLLQYECLYGMTGTARSAEKELNSMYGLTVDVIPPHIPSIRQDWEPFLCETEQEKSAAVLTAAAAAHEKGQPVLIGTQSVGQSESYSKLLSQNGLAHYVLNAKNDVEEAQIVADAGLSSAITISTNMAGRGVDIRLGGEGEKEKKDVQKAGGLLVIGCGLHRSQRLERQLVGRAGRLGDQTWLRKIQRGEERKDAELRYMLEKYAYILERKRRELTDFREGILMEKRTAEFLKADQPEKYENCVRLYGQKAVEMAEKQLCLYFINQHWADYLAVMENLRSGIHLSLIGGLNPVEEYDRFAVNAYQEMEKDIREDVINALLRCEITETGVDLEQEGMLAATATYSYMINESSSQFMRLPKLFGNR